MSRTLSQLAKNKGSDAIPADGERWSIQAKSIQQNFSLASCPAFAATCPRRLVSVKRQVRSFDWASYFCLLMWQYNNILCV